MSMKRIIFAILGVALLCSFAQARLYLGVEGGYSVQKQFDAPNIFNVPNTDVIANSFKNGAKGYSLAFVLGGESFYGRYFGTRFGLSAGYTALTQDMSDVSEGAESTKEKFSYIDAGLELDLIVNFYNNSGYSIGVFGGVDAKYHYRLENISSGNDVDSIVGALFGSSKHLLDFSGRVGITTLLANHHRLDLMFRLPIASTNALLIGGSVLPARTTASLGYKFVF